jgi:hypothetical protein
MKMVATRVVTGVMMAEAALVAARVIVLVTKRTITTKTMQCDLSVDCSSSNDGRNNEG